MHAYTGTFMYTDGAVSNFGGEVLNAYAALKCFRVESPRGTGYSSSSGQDAALRATL